jgi:hypothetical protein
MNSPSLCVFFVVIIFFSLTLFWLINDFLFDIHWVGTALIMFPHGKEFGAFHSFSNHHHIITYHPTLPLSSQLTVFDVKLLFYFFGFFKPVHDFLFLRSCDVEGGIFF